MAFKIAGPRAARQPHVICHSMNEPPHMSGRGSRLWLHRLCVRVFFDRVTVIYPENIPKSGPVLFLALHRNGAVDGFVYHTIIPESVFMVSTQLRKNWFARLFFSGIEVTREKDRDRETADNSEAVDECAAHLRAGGKLFIFPEGTSSLGPRHLPFKSGAARLIDAMMDSGGPMPAVVPVGIHYECGWACRSQVEVVFGPALNLDLAGTTRRRLVEIKLRIHTALEAVGAQFESDSIQQTAELLAYGRTLGTGKSFFSGLKKFEQGLPPAVLAAWQELRPVLNQRGLLRHQGVPLFPVRPPWLYGLATVMFSAPVIAAAILNAPPLALAAFAGAKFADAPNVIALWRILIGVPALLIWWVVLAVATVFAGKLEWFLGGIIISIAGLLLSRRAVKVTIAFFNAVQFRALRKRMLAFYRLLHQDSFDDPAL